VYYYYKFYATHGSTIVAASLNGRGHVPASEVRHSISHDRRSSALRAEFFLSFITGRVGVTPPGTPGSRECHAEPTKL